MDSNLNNLNQDNSNIQNNNEFQNNFQQNNTNVNQQSNIQNNISMNSNFFQSTDQVNQNNNFNSNIQTNEEKQITSQVINQNQQNEYTNSNEIPNRNKKSNKLIIAIIIGLVIVCIIIIVFLKLFKSNSNSVLVKDIDVKKYITLVDDADNNGEVSIGDKYTYKVNDKDTFNFYVLSIEDDFINLIMDRNICNDGTTPLETGTGCYSIWYDDGDEVFDNSKNDKGPVTTMAFLYDGTKDWTNVPNMNLDYDDVEDQKKMEKGEYEDSKIHLGSTKYGYGGIKIENGVGTIIEKNGKKQPIKLENNKPIKARLPKYSEIKTIEIKEKDIILPFWLTEYLDSTSNEKASEKYKSNKKVSGMYGYWLISSDCTTSNRARNVERLGASLYQPIDTPDYGGGYGVRPVITIPKDSIIK